MNDWLKVIGEKVLESCSKLSDGLSQPTQKNQRGQLPSKKLQSWVGEVPSLVENQFSDAMQKLNKNLGEQAQLRKSLREENQAEVKHNAMQSTELNNLNDPEYPEQSEFNLSPVGGSSPMKAAIHSQDKAITLDHIDSLRAAPQKKKREEVAHFLGESIAKIVASSSAKTSSLKQALLNKNKEAILIADQRGARSKKQQTLAKTKKEGVLQFFGNFVSKVIEAASSKTNNLKEAIKGKNSDKRDQIVEHHPRRKSKENPETHLEESPIKLLKDPLPEKINPLEHRKPSQKTIEELKKAIKEYQKEDADEAVESLSRKQVTDVSHNVSATKLGLNMSSIEHDALNKGAKSFKINRRNPMPSSPQTQGQPLKQISTTGLPSLSVPKNVGDLRNNSQMKKSNEMRLNEIKMSYSHARRAEDTQDRSIDAKLRRLRRDHQPKLDTQAMGKYDYRGRDFQNSLQMNIDFLLNLKKEGTASKLIKRELVQDSKINKIVGNMVNSDSYHRVIDKDTRAFLEDIRLPPSKKQVKGIVRQKPFSIYHPTQKNELYRLN